MEIQSWLETWEKNYIPFHQPIVNDNLIKYFDQIQLDKNIPVLVPLCGKSYDLFWLAQQGYKVYGIEISPIACESFFIEHGIKPNIIKEKTFIRYRYNNIELICADLFSLQTENFPSFKAIYDSQALIAFPREKRPTYLSHLLRFSDQDVKLLLFANESNNDVQGPPYPLKENEINSLYTPYFFNIKILQEEDKTTQIPNRLIKKGFKELVVRTYLISDRK